MTRPPAASVIIPTYNGAAYLAEAIDSVLSQDFDDFELLVLDNASTDETPEIIARYDDRRLVYHRNEKNRGLAGNVGLGCQLAAGTAAMFLGSDDRLLPGFLRAALAFLDREPGVAMVHGPAVWIDAQGRRFGGSGAPWPRLTPGPRAMLGAFTRGFCFSTMMMRTDAIRATGPFDQGWQEVIDLWLFERMCLAGDVGFLDAVHVEYRVHDAAMSMPMYRDNLMFRRQMAAAAECFSWPEAAASAPLRRRAERAAARIAIQTLHMSRPAGLDRYTANLAEILRAVPEALLWPTTWARLGFGLLPGGAIDHLRRARHRAAVSKGTAR